MHDRLIVLAAGLLPVSLFKHEADQTKEPNSHLQGGRQTSKRIRRSWFIFLAGGVHVRRTIADQLMHARPHHSSTTNSNFPIITINLGKRLFILTNQIWHNKKHQNHKSFKKQKSALKNNK
jgi:hypothetical protein